MTGASVVPGPPVEATAPVAIPGLSVPTPAGDTIRRLARSDDPLGGSPIDTDLAAALKRRRGRGRPLPDGIARSISDAVGADPERVRIHTGAEPAALARSVQAVAFTQGPDIYFGSGAFSPHTVTGQRVLAHELAHTVQPAAGAGGIVGRAADPAEADADRRADTALRRLQRRAGVDAEGRVPEADRPRERAGSTAGIRRLVGFEVEISVPTIAVGTSTPVLAAGDNAPAPEIGNFFGGALTYKQELGSIAGPDRTKITLTPDHNQLEAKGAEVFAALKEMSPRALAGATYVPLSNLEYGTPALDELAPGSDARFQAMASAIDAHTKKIMDADPQHVLSAIPDTRGFRAGAPQKLISTWLSGVPKSERFKTAWNEMAKLIKWEMYVQATVGIMPTGLASLYAQQAKDMPADPDAPDSSLAAIKDGMDAIAALSATFDAQPFVTDLKLKPGDVQALRGVLTMAASYAVGNALGRTSLMSDTAKNSVQMLLKLARTGLVVDALPTYLKKFKGAGANPKVVTLIDQAATWIHQMPQTWLDHWTDEPYEAEVTREPIYGRPTMDPVDATKALITDMLTGTATIPVIGPGDEGRLPKNDAAPAAVAAASGAQQGIPLEFRWITEFPDGPGELWKVFASVLRDVRAANLALIPESDAAPILAAVKKP